MDSDAALTGPLVATTLESPDPIRLSGLAGQSIRDQELDGDWWAAVYTSDQNANYGALFGVFYIDGQGDLAYFKDIDGHIADEFWVVSDVNPG